MNYFEQLAAINCADKTEKKGNLTYLSWAWAWDKIKRLHPTAFYTIYENADGMFYHTDGRTAWVKTGVSVDVEGTMVEHVEYLPVMDNKNRSIALEHITSFDVNKAIQRSLTKAVARHGLGLYIYAGEDLPDGDPAADDKPEPVFARAKTIDTCESCGKKVVEIRKNREVVKTADEVIAWSKEAFGKTLCWDCAKKEMSVQDGNG